VTRLFVGGDDIRGRWILIQYGCTRQQLTLSVKSVIKYEIDWVLFLAWTTSWLVKKFIE
jgi:hypothetical protein